MGLSLQNSCFRSLLSITLGILAFGSVAAEEQTIEINRNDFSVSLNGQPASGEIQVPEGQIYFRFTVPAGEPETVGRFIFKLEGSDPEWRECFPGAEDMMRVAVLFYGADKNCISHKSFGEIGNSPGWTGAVETSPLVMRKESFPVPNGAVSLSILISSAGPPQTVGALAVGSLRLAKLGDSNGTPLMNLEFPEGPELKAPAGWYPTGTQPGYAQVVASNLAPAHRLLAIRDEDKFNHADWQSRQIALDAGGMLQMEWTENFTVGTGGNRYFRYSRLEHGRYLFRFKKLTALGMPMGLEGEFVLRVVPPFYKRTWFLVMCATGAAGLAIGSFRYRSWRQAQLEIARLREQNAIQAERARIARDLHDTLEQGLTGISMQVRCIADALEDAPAELMESIKAARRLVKQCHTELRESIWNLRSGDVEPINLEAALRHMAESLAAGTNIQIEIQPDLKGIRLPATIETNLLRIAQESITNAVKNAGASQILIALSANSSLVSLRISDNGSGFSGDIDSLRKRGHYGLQGMQERTQNMGGQLKITSGEGGGCVVHVTVPLSGTQT